MKYTTTEKYHTNCPNCGAAIGPDDKFCKYCGTSVVYERTYVQEDTYTMDGSKVDIESKALAGGKSASIAGILFTIVWCGFAFFMTGAFFSMAGAMAIFPFGMFCFGVYLVVKQIKDYIQFSYVSQNGARYSAVVLDHCIYQETRGSGNNRRIVTLAKVKVLATIDGQQKVIMIQVGDPSNAARYPEGSSVTIAGSGDYYVLM